MHFAVEVLGPEALALLCTNAGVRQTEKTPEKTTNPEMSVLVRMSRPPSSDWVFSNLSRPHLGSCKDLAHHEAGILSPRRRVVAASFRT